MDLTYWIITIYTILIFKLDRKEIWTVDLSFFLLNTFLVLTLQESLDILDKILLFLGINCTVLLSSSGRAYSILSSNIEVIWLKNIFFPNTRKDQIWFLLFLSDMSIKIIEKSIKSLLRVSNIWFSYLCIRDFEGN